jgi:hypothetical protein
MNSLSDHCSSIGIDDATVTESLSETTLKCRKDNAMIFHSAKSLRSVRKIKFSLVLVQLVSLAVAVVIFLLCSEFLKSAISLCF